jgi:hypothetical protein
MAITITINGVDQTAKCIAAQLEGGRRLNYNRVAGSPATLTLSTYDRTGGGGGYRPAIDHTVVVADGATTLFSGVITDIREQALTDPSLGWDKGILCNVTCADQNGLLLRDSYTKTYADGTTLKQVLQDLIANPLSTRGVTLDGAQANGSALTGFKFVDAYIDDILNSLTTITGWIWDITPAKVLSMISPGSVSCGFSLTDGGGSLYGGVTVEQGRSENYANRVTVVAGPAAQLVKTETITGNGILDHWVLTYTPITDANGYILSRGLVNENGADLTLSPPGGGGSYTWTAATNTLTRAAGALPNLQVSTLIYAVQFPISVTVNDAGEQAAHGIYARRYTAEDVTDLATTTQLATGLLSRGIASPQIVHVAHRKGLAQMGRSVVLTFSERNINATFMIVEVSFWNEVDGSISYAIGAVSGSTQPDSWVDYFKRGGAGSVSGASAAPISGSIVPALSGIFQQDLVAHSGLDDTSVGSETALTTYGNSAGVGGALRLGRSDRAYCWMIVADADDGATPGTRGRLRFHLRRKGSTFESCFLVAEDGSDHYVMLPGNGLGAVGGFYLGDYGGFIPGVGGVDAQITGILCADIMATAGYFERSRTTRMGEWIPVSFSAGNFTGNGAMTVTVASGDQITYAYRIVGKSLKVSVVLNTFTIGGTPNTTVRVAIPGGFTATKAMGGPVFLVNNNVEEIGRWEVAASGTVIEFRRLAAANWTAAADVAYIRADVEFEVN